MSVLDLRNLRVRFDTERGPVQAVESASLRLEAGEMRALVGESGSGKSVTALALLRLLPRATTTIETGEAWFGGRNLLTLGERELRAVRGSEIALVPQDPGAALHPLYTIGDQIVEALQLHRPVSRAQARELAAAALHEVGVPAAGERLDAYPHELSGGLRQRAMIAMAIALEPVLLIADEPTTALDVTVQAQILELLAELRRRRGMAILLITHDLGVVARHAQQVSVMYAGSIVESGAVRDVFAAPAHPYTRGLLRSAAALDADPDARLEPIRGMPPDPGERAGGCAFEPRCDFAVEICKRGRPPQVPPSGLRRLRELGLDFSPEAERERRVACYENERVVALARSEA